MYLNFLYIYFSAAVISFFLTGILGAEEESEVHSMIGEWIQYTFQCKKESDDAGNKVELATCIKLYKGENLDDTQPEYTPCKCLGSCISKKTGSMLPDGSAWNVTKIDEITKLFSQNEQYKNFADEFQNKVRPTCRLATGQNCDLAFNTIKCIFDNSESARNLRDMFAGMLKE
ncbi:uncharacterized protein LOC142331415 [Lycorma delicatula]|uniref:uncharacterized protein LOC142331415 n=1 Tax=Lycorma delicatula TaxID=130591 RepID=UPI003F51A0DE